MERTHLKTKIKNVMQISLSPSEKPLSPSDKQEAIRQWVKSNRGIQAEIVRMLGVKKAYVSGVMRLKFYSRNGAIESVLADLGAPHMHERHLEARAKMLYRDQWTIKEIERLLSQLRLIQRRHRAKPKQSDAA